MFIGINDDRVILISQNAEIVEKGRVFTAGKAHREEYGIGGAKFLGSDDLFQFAARPLQAGDGLLDNLYSISQKVSA